MLKQGSKTQERAQSWWKGVPKACIREAQGLGKNLAWECDVEGCRRSTAEKGLFQQSRREIRAIRLGWWRQRFGAVVRAETYVGDGTYISRWCFGHERLRNRALPCFLVWVIGRTVDSFTELRIRILGEKNKFYFGHVMLEKSAWHAELEDRQLHTCIWTLRRAWIRRNNSESHQHKFSVVVEIMQTNVIPYEAYT